MSVSVRLHGTSAFGSLDFERETFHMMIDGPADQAEQFAQVLESIAADLRRMFPPASQPSEDVPLTTPQADDEKLMEQPKSRLLGRLFR